MSFLRPTSIAVVGASSESTKVGGAIFQNLITQGFAGTVYPVNAKHSEVQGKKAYASVKDLPETPEMVIVVTPAASVEAIAEECGDKGVKYLIVISAGFGELGTDDARAMETRLAKICSNWDMTLVGPNCLGFLCPGIKLNASFAKELPPQGSVAFISQSGALAVGFMDASSKVHLGFSCVLSLGN